MAINHDFLDQRRPRKAKCQKTIPMYLENPIKKKLLGNGIADFRINTWHHIIFWAIYFLLNFLRWGSYFNDYLYSLKANLLGFPIHITLAYFTIYYLVPKFIFKRKFISFALILLFSIFVMVYLKYLLTFFLISYNVWPEGPETHSLTFNYAVVMMLGELYVITFAASFKLTIDWLRETDRVARLQKEQLETELRFLRAQISPHFFFNTLNNIYALSLEKSDRAPDTIIKLSDLMRYVLYGTRNKNQCLKKELDFMANYIELERIRHNQDLELNYEVTGEPKGKKIAPLLLVQFIENAFKHGANRSIGKVTIDIFVRIEEKFIYFRVSNTKPPGEAAPDKRNEGGIGLSNVEKRLKLRYREDEYRLDTFDGPENYTINLKLKLR